ncbi:MAG: GNAT family N-acetyltransferase [Deltaproteobacteria bacterium]
MVRTADLASGRMTTRLDIREETSDTLHEYARIPIAFEVGSVVQARQAATSGAEFVLDERRLSMQFVKDYDAIPNNGPLDWPKRFDVTAWGFLAARSGGSRVGGATVVIHCPDVDMLEARDDLALLWDIRVAPDVRGMGVGSALLAASEQWALERGARWLKAETQNINAPACRFYARHGFTLKTVNALAYPELPYEIQFLWYKEISGTGARAITA